jgi:RHS repeat-associated protein
MFKSPIAINESNKGKINFEYNSHLSRSKMLYDYGLIAPSTVKEQRKTKLYTDDGSTEVVFDAVANTIQMRTFIGGDAYSAVLYDEKTINNTTGVTTEHDYYLHRDYLGSILAITNEVGVAQEQRAFDAWGNLAKLVNATGDSVAVTGGLQFFDRGYTGHEHLQEVRLIHMNGRLYDPVLRSFLMPDNFVQQPENTQNYNRYAYVLNNPLKYTDPSGEELISLTCAVIIGAAIAATTYTLTALLTDVPFTVGGLAQATFIGAASAAVTFGIGSACGTIGNFFVRSSVQAVAHGAFQGAMTEASGGKFWSGFAAGALSSIASSAWSGGDTNTTGFAKENNWAYGAKTITHAGLGEGLGNAGMVAFSTVVGGGAAVMTGGNFWVGAATGLVVSVCNHLAHPMSDDTDPPSKTKTQNDIRKETVKPSFAKLLEVEGNVIGVADLAHSSKAMNWARGGTSGIKTISSGLKIAGNTLGGVGVGLEYLDYRNGNMSGLEFSVDAVFAVAPMFFPVLAPVSLGYFAGKAIYEYSSGHTAFTKP